MRAILRLIGAFVLAVICAIGTTACAGEPSTQFGEAQARAVTTTEAETLAAMRFRNFDAGSRSVSFAMTEQGVALTFSGWFDYENSVGYGELDADGAPNSLLLWTHDTLLVHSPTGTEAPLPPPADDWESGALDGSTSGLHAALGIIAAVGSDRPDNPLLLQQGGALWLGIDVVEADGDAIDVTVFAGPLSDEPIDSDTEIDADASTVRYWVTETGVAYRIDTRLGGEWVTIMLGNGDDVRIEAPATEDPAS